VRILLLCLALLAPISSQAQLLSLKDLQFICSEKGWVGSNNLLISKGWLFEDSEKLAFGLNLEYHAKVEWSLNRTGSIADAWVTARIEDPITIAFTGGYGNEVTFQFFDVNHYQTFIDELTKSGTLVSSNIENSILIYLYEMNGFDFEVKMSKDRYTIIAEKSERRKANERIQKYMDKK
jgi:hypothetical protein